MHAGVCGPLVHVRNQAPKTAHGAGRGGQGGLPVWARLARHSPLQRMPQRVSLQHMPHRAFLPEGAEQVAMRACVALGERAYLAMSTL